MGGNQSTQSPYPSSRSGVQTSPPPTRSSPPNRDLLSTPLTFHQVHGENIVLTNNSRIAKRAESFCKGICFSNRPVGLGEKILIRFTEVSTNWSGVLRVGLTSVDPDSMRVATLPRYACPDLTNKTGHWAKALNERYAEQNNLLYFYVTREGTVMYGVNDVEKGAFFSGVGIGAPLWVMADIYGNTIAIEIQSGGLMNQAPAIRHQSVDSPVIGQPSTPTGNQTFRPPPPDTRIVCPAIRYHANATFSPMPLSSVYGRHITLLANRTIASRSVDDFCQGYIFTSRPMQAGEKIVIQVLATALNYFGGLCFGVTACDPLSLCPTQLPDDSDNLLDRGEYWVVNKDVCNDPSVGDELSFTLSFTGEVRYSRNSHRPTTLMHVDTTLPLWVFFDLYGNLQKLRVLGVTSTIAGRQSNEINAGLRVTMPSPQFIPGLPNPVNSPGAGCHSATSSGDAATAAPVWLPRDQQKQVDNVDTSIVVEEQAEITETETISECTVCYEAPVDSVIYTCGHMCMCYKCAQVVKNGHDALCPICRQEIKDVIKIYKS